MADSPDVFVDQFKLAMGPFGCAMVFGVRAMPGAELEQETRVATIRMSLEHLKVMSFLIHKSMRDYQAKLSVRVEIPDEVLKSLSISREDWADFWREEQGNR